MTAFDHICSGRFYVTRSHGDFRSFSMSTRCSDFAVDLTKLFREELAWYPLCLNMFARVSMFSNKETIFEVF